MAHAVSSTVDLASLARPTSEASLAPFALDGLVERIRAEFIEQPGLRLTEAQGCRLWQLDRPTLQRVLGTLTDASFLSVSPDGRYTRPSVL